MWQDRRQLPTCCSPGPLLTPLLLPMPPLLPRVSQGQKLTDVINETHENKKYFPGSVWGLRGWAWPGLAFVTAVPLLSSPAAVFFTVHSAADGHARALGPPSPCPAPASLCAICLCRQPPPPPLSCLRMHMQTHEPVWHARMHAAIRYRVRRTPTSPHPPLSRGTLSLSSSSSLPKNTQASTWAPT